MIEAEHILREELERFRLWQQSLGKSSANQSRYFFLYQNSYVLSGAIPTIAKLQEKAESMRLEEMNKVSM